MAEHLSLQQLEDYGRQRLTAAELIAVDDHLTGCAVCRQHTEAALPVTAVSFYSEWQAAAEPPSAPHLEFEQLAGYVDDTLSVAERQLVADHLTGCASCAQTADDLRAFKAESIAQPVMAQASEASWWSKLRALLWPAAPAPAFGLALAVLLLVVMAGWLIRLALQGRPAPQEFARGGASPSVSPRLQPSPAPSITPESAPLLASLNDGDRQITLDRQGRLTGLDDLSPAYQQLVKEALTTERLATPELAGLNRRASSLMGADEQGNRFALLAPVGKVVLTDRPTFRWTPLAGAASYVVEIYDEQFNLVRQSPASPSTAWTPTEPLARGHLYAWQVKANQDGQVVQAPKPPAAQARFRILAQAQADEILRARRTQAASHLTLGLLYAQAGLLDEAEQELRTLRQANPDSEAVRRWLAQVQARRR